MHVSFSKVLMHCSQQKHKVMFGHYKLFVHKTYFVSESYIDFPNSVVVFGHQMSLLYYGSQFSYCHLYGYFPLIEL